MDDEQQRGYAWEDEYKRSWDALIEDEAGSLLGVVSSMQRQQLLLKKKKLGLD